VRCDTRCGNFVAQHQRIRQSRLDVEPGNEEKKGREHCLSLPFFTSTQTFLYLKPFGSSLCFVMWLFLLLLLFVRVLVKRIS
jgi:hypothetical protein